MNYSRFSKFGTTYIDGSFEIIADDKIFHSSDIKNVDFKFDLSGPDFSTDKSTFDVYTSIKMYSQLMKMDILKLATQTEFELKDFYLSHNTEILFECCQLAFEQTLVKYEEGTKGKPIENILIQFDESKLKTNLTVYLESYHFELNKYIKLHFP